MQHDHALIERLVTEFIAGYMSFFSGNYFVETYTDSATRVEVIRQVTRAAFTNAYALVRKYQGGLAPTKWLPKPREKAGSTCLPSAGKSCSGTRGL